MFSGLGPSAGNIESVFVVQGHSNWKRTKEKLKKHSLSDVHKICMSRWLAFKATEVHGTVADQLSTGRERTIQENRKLLKSIANVVILCARQTIALRGHCESISSGNKGNFLEILQVVASENPSLQEQLESCPRNAKYTSNIIQNDLLHAASDVKGYPKC